VFFVFVFVLFCFFFGPFDILYFYRGGAGCNAHVAGRRLQRRTPKFLAMPSRHRFALDSPTLSLATEHCCSRSKMIITIIVVFLFSSCVVVVDVAVRGTYSFLDVAAAAPCRDSWLQEMKNKKKKIGAYYRPSGCRSRHAVSRFSIFAHGPAANSSSSKAGSGWGEREERRRRRAPRGPPATLVSTTTTSVS